MTEDKRVKDDARVVVAYVMLMFIICFGIGIGWIGHMMLTSVKQAECVHVQSN
jgi:hypothetical protein